MGRVLGFVRMEETPTAAAGTIRVPFRAAKGCVERAWALGTRTNGTTGSGQVGSGRSARGKHFENRCEACKPG